MSDTFFYSCPYCGSENSGSLDYSAGDRQEWITDCEVCCRPMVVRLTLSGDTLERVDVRQENE